MTITFHGAARSVTGSRHLVETPAGRVLLDCGLFQGRRQEGERSRCNAAVHRRFPHVVGFSECAFAAIIQRSGCVVQARDPEKARPRLDPGRKPVSCLREALARFAGLAQCFGGRRQVGKDHAQNNNDLAKWCGQRAATMRCRTTNMASISRLTMLNATPVANAGP